eukprot:gene1564-3020_t
MFFAFFLLVCFSSTAFSWYNKLPFVQKGNGVGGTKLDSFSLKFLESNSWIWNINDFSILVDPVMDVLDFGIPVFYSGRKKFIDGNTELDRISGSVDFVLISQGLDDHAHTPTLKRLVKMRPGMNYIAPPSAKPVMNQCGISDSNINFISPGQAKTMIKGSSEIEIIATSGALVGPPWEAPQNGYIIKSKKTFQKSFSMYYEPHCMYDPSELSRYQVDYVISPVVAQELPAYTLVAGQEKALDLAKLLKAKTVIPMNNGELEQSGILSLLVRTRGTVESFKTLVSQSGTGIKVVDAPAGEFISLL